MPTLLTIAGRSFTTSYQEGAIARLETTGTWTELASGNAVFWGLENFVKGNVHTLWHIRSDGQGPDQSPDGGKLYRSVDQGDTWVEVTPNTATEFARSMAQDANGDLWLVTSEQEPHDAVPSNEPSRIYKSTDNGVTWVESLEIPETSFSTRNWQAYNITCHPTNANIIIAEGVEQVGSQSRLWRTTDGGSTWEAAFAPTVESPPTLLRNVSNAQTNVFNYTKAGDLVWSGPFETAADDLFILKSLDDGDNFNVYFTEVAAAAYSLSFFESDTQVYMLHRGSTFASNPTVGQGEITKIASNDDSPFIGGNTFRGFDVLPVHSVSTLHLGSHIASPGIGATTDPSVFTRPADLSSDWVEHASWGNMDADLGYRLYPATDGLVGATAFEQEEPVPPKFDEPPAGDPGAGEPGAGEPGIGEARMPRREPVVRRGLRGRRGFKAGPPGHRGLPPVQGEQIDKRIPDEYEEPLVRKWLTFGWLAVPMLEGAKTITLRDWGPTEGVQWQHGELFYAYDTPPVEGGRRLAILRVMQEPFVEFTARLRMSDYHKLGYSYAMANRLMAPSGRTALQVWEDLHNNPESLWLLRFAVERIFEQGRKEQGTVQIAERPPQ